MKTLLADTLRPDDLEDFLGQEHIVGEGSILRASIDNDSLKSMIFFGPSGTGKTTLAEIISKRTNSVFIKMNATSSKTADIRNAMAESTVNRDIKKQKTILLMDEVHRLNKNVQDILLPHVEKGNIILIGMTTENPFFAINHALISRTIMFEFNNLDKKHLIHLLSKVRQYYKKEGKEIKFDKESANYLIGTCSGDARRLITSVQFIVDAGFDTITIDHCRQVMPRKFCNIDKDTAIYDSLSAIQGSIQASDIDGAIFWLGQAINEDGDIKSICRRLLVTASEDVGCCNPMALVHTYAAVKSALIVGFPEAKIILGSAVAYLAMNKRSKAAHDAINKSMKLDISQHIKIPDYLRDCHYKGSEEIGHGHYKDGRNMSVYNKFPLKLFEPRNGEEINLYKHNEKLWRSRDEDKASVTEDE